MQDIVLCRYGGKGLTSFYLVSNGNEYFLFSQAYRKGISRYYSNGVSVDKAIDATRSKRDTAILRTMDKLPVYIRYLEKEYGLCILNRHKDKKVRQKLSYKCRNGYGKMYVETVGGAN